MAAQSGQTMKIYPAAADEPVVRSWGHDAAFDARLVWIPGPVDRPAPAQYVFAPPFGREAELIADLKALSAEVCRLAREVDGIREQLAAPGLIARDVSKQDAKAEVATYLQREGRAFPSDISEVLSLDYDMVAEILDELRQDGQVEFEAPDGIADAS